MTDLNILFEIGMQQQLYQRGGEQVPRPQLAPKRMNSDAETLANLYKKLKEDGELTRKEIAALDSVDQVLDNASIKINPQTGNAKITQNDGKEFEIKFR